jgi:putative PIN family toxin of toxin-antitoxin system
VRLVLDTNVTVSGLLWQGNPGKLIDAAHAVLVTLHTSAPLLAELRDVLHREKFAKPLAALGLAATVMFEGYAALATVVVPAILPPTIVEDPDDDAVLACAVAAEADYIVSGDPHLLKLQQFRNIPIVTPTQAVEQLSI